MLNGNIKTVTKLYNRCLAITLADGSTVNVKVMGDKVAAAADCAKLTAALTK
ncbi:MAG: hypothetical protein KGL39_42600 [Patescibacteria group bacterium]|nr:hypothetical protein [Patescibacteria group bacterium]